MSFIDHEQNGMKKTQSFATMNLRKNEVHERNLGVQAARINSFRIPENRGMPLESNLSSPISAQAPKPRSLERPHSFYPIRHGSSSGPSDLGSLLDESVHVFPEPRSHLGSLQSSGLHKLSRLHSTGNFMDESNSLFSEVSAEPPGYSQQDELKRVQSMRFPTSEMSKTLESSSSFILRSPKERSPLTGTAMNRMRQAGVPQTDRRLPRQTDTRDKGLQRFVSFRYLNSEGRVDPQRTSSFGLDDSDDEQEDVVAFDDNFDLDMPLGSGVGAPEVDVKHVSKKGGLPRLDSGMMMRKAFPKTMFDTADVGETSNTSTNPYSAYHEPQPEPVFTKNNNVESTPAFYPQYQPPPQHHHHQQNHNHQRFSPSPPNNSNYLPYQQNQGLNQGMNPGFPGVGVGMPYAGAYDMLQQSRRDQQIMQQQYELIMNMMMQQQSMPNPAMHTSPSVSPNMHFQHNVQNKKFSSPNPNMDDNVSQLLIKHKTTGYKPTLSELRGHIIEFSRDSHGSRLIQSLMETASKHDKHQAVEEVLVDAVSVMQDLFGNYVMQNFLEHADAVQKEFIADIIKSNMNTLSMQPHGCRVVQKAIDTLDSSTRNQLLLEVVDTPEKIVQCAKDPHATHVLQKAVVYLQKELDRNVDVSLKRQNVDILEVIESAVSAEVLQLAVHPHACRLIQKVLGDCDASRSPHVRSMLREILADNRFDKLSVDQHGNFILQHLLDHGTEEHSHNVQKFVSTKILELSQHKFGSHLVEKCFQTAKSEDAALLINELMAPARELSRTGAHRIGQDFDGDELLSLMKDPYANFVVQRAFDASKGALRQEMKREIQRRAEVLSRFTYGRHILSHISRNDHDGPH